MQTRFKIWCLVFFPSWNVVPCDSDPTIPPCSRLDAANDPLPSPPFNDGDTVNFVCSLDSETVVTATCNNNQWNYNSVDGTARCPMNDGETSLSYCKLLSTMTICLNIVNRYPSSIYCQPVTSLLWIPTSNKTRVLCAFQFEISCPVQGATSFYLLKQTFPARTQHVTHLMITPICQYLSPKQWQLRFYEICRKLGIFLTKLVSSNALELG